MELSNEKIEKVHLENLKGLLLSDFNMKVLLQPILEDIDDQLDYQEEQLNLEENTPELRGEYNRQRAPILFDNCLDSFSYKSWEEIVSDERDILDKILDKIQDWM